MPHREMEGGRTTLLWHGSAASSFTDGLLCLWDDERNSKTELQPHFLSVLMERKERELELQPWGRERKRGVHGGGRGGAAAVSSALYLCVREGGGNMASCCYVHACN